MTERLEQDARDRRYRLTWDDFEARVRTWLSELPPAKPMELGDAVAWIGRENGKADRITAVHHYCENGQTFCKLAIPSAVQHIPVLDSLDVCPRCRAMSRRAVHYAKMAAQRAELRVSA